MSQQHTTPAPAWRGWLGGLVVALLARDVCAVLSAPDNVVAWAFVVVWLFSLFALALDAVSDAADRVDAAVGDRQQQVADAKLRHPDGRRLTHDEARRVIRDRYGPALDDLGRRP